jgi:hypothetical protein
MGEAWARLGREAWGTSASSMVDGGGDDDHAPRDPDIRASGTALPTPTLPYGPYPFLSLLLFSLTMLEA